MYKLHSIINKNNFQNKELLNFLDSRFGVDYIKQNKKDIEKSLSNWGKKFKTNLPRKKIDKLNYISQSYFYYSNYNGRACVKYNWPLFFDLYPNGVILIIDLDEHWFHEIWKGQLELGRSFNFDKDEFHNKTPQQMSGCQSDNLPLMVLNIAAFGFYPYILFNYSHTSSNLTFIYLPSEKYKHSQMMDNNNFNSILWSFHHLFDDKWTFNGSRGPKSEILPKSFSINNKIDLIMWLVHNLNQRMHDLLNINDYLKREQLAMTYNRVICDAILSATTQLPYMSKVFFFNCMDKLSNILNQLDSSISENDYWKQIISIDYLKNDVMTSMLSIPKKIKDIMVHLLEWICDIIRIDEITPDLLRDLRNSNHGYALRPNTVNRLFNHSGEFNNDLTLLTIPLILHFLTIKWNL